MPNFDTSYGQAGEQLIYSSLLTASAASFDVQGIDANWAHLRLILSGRTSVAGADDLIIVRFNNDSSAVYDSVDCECFTSVSSAVHSAQTGGYLGFIAAASATAGFVGLIDMLIFDYTSTVVHKAWKSHCFLCAGGSGSIYNLMEIGEWRSSAAVNRVTVLSVAGASFVAGTRCSLYGVPG